MNKEIMIDASNLCNIKCHKCERQAYFKNKEKIPGGNLTIEQFKKVISYYNDMVGFCGQRSDPVLNPNLPEFLKILYERNIKSDVYTASDYRDLEWYKNCFKINPETKWTFGLDGLPEQSHLYRRNQNGFKMWEIMCEASKYLKQKPVWQYIVFSYNEDNIEEAKQMAKENNIIFELNISSRFDVYDPYLPKNKIYAKNIS